MPIPSLALTYLMIWWIVFFMALPVGIRAEDSPVKGQDSGAPKNPCLGRKMLATTIISALLLWLFIYLVQINVLTLRMVTG